MKVPWKLLLCELLFLATARLGFSQAQLVRRAGASSAAFIGSAAVPGPRELKCEGSEVSVLGIHRTRRNQAMKSFVVGLVINLG
jgi:hypothetical protein